MSSTTVTFTDPDVIIRAQRNARERGLSLHAYLSRLILKDTRTNNNRIEVFPVEHGWGPVPKHIQERWDEEEQQFKEEEKQGKHPGFQTVEALMQDLNA